MTTTIGTARRRPDEAFRELMDKPGRAYRFLWLGERVDDVAPFFKLSVLHDGSRKCYVVRATTGRREYKSTPTINEGREYSFDISALGSFLTGEGGEHVDTVLHRVPVARFNAAKFKEFTKDHVALLRSGAYDDKLPADVPAIMAVRP